MTTVKRNSNLTDYTTVLPYASEMFGVYQPLIGWKSKRIEERFNKGSANDKNTLIDSLKRQFAGVVQVTYKEDAKVDIQIRPGVIAGVDHPARPQRFCPAGVAKDAREE